MSTYLVWHHSCIANRLFSPLAGAHRERVLFEAKLARTEAEMRAVFEQKVHDQELKLKQAEIELYARHAEATEALNRQRAMLEERRRILERDSEDLGVGAL
jgi:septin 7